MPWVSPPGLYLCCRRGELKALLAKHGPFIMSSGAQIEERTGQQGQFGRLEGFPGASTER